MIDLDQWLLQDKRQSPQRSSKQCASAAPTGASHRPVVLTAVQPATSAARPAGSQSEVASAPGAQLWMALHPDRHAIDAAERQPVRPGDDSAQRAQIALGEPQLPRLAQVLRQDEVAPYVQQVVEPDKALDVGGRALGQDLLVHETSLRRIAEVVGPLGPTPPNVKRELHELLGLGALRRQALRDGDRSGGGTD